MKHRIKHFRAKQGWTQEQLAEKLGNRLLTVHNLENYKTRLNIDTLESLAQIFNVSPLELLDTEETKNINPKTGNRKVSVMGYVGAGAEIFPIDSFGDNGDEVDYVEVPVSVSKNSIALRIRGNSQYPRYLEGDTVVYGEPRSDEHSLTQMVGQDVVVKLSDGHMLLKKLLFSPAPGRWNLGSYNDEEMANQEVLWAARIEAILPR